MLEMFSAWQNKPRSTKMVELRKKNTMNGDIIIIVLNTNKLEKLLLNYQHSL